MLKEAVMKKRWRRRKRSNSKRNNLREITPSWENLKGALRYEMMQENGHTRTWERKAGGWEEEKGGWSGEDSLAYAGLVHWAFPAPLFHLTLFSLLLFSRNIWVGGREKEKVTASEVMTEWGGESDRGSRWLVSRLDIFRNCSTIPIRHQIFMFKKTGR